MVATVGDHTTELWLGNEHVYQLLQSYGSTKCELRIEADAFDGTGCWVVASNFRMNNESNRYAMDWDSVVASKADLVEDWNYHKLKLFRTPDKYVGRLGCVNVYNAGWWYGDCVRIFLNGEYANRSVATFKSISVFHFKHETALKRSRMMFRPMSDVRPCNNPCENGGTCEYDDATKTTACKCGAQLYGPTCEHVMGTTVKDKGLSVTMIVLVALLLLWLLIAWAIAARVLLQRRKRRLEEEQEAARRIREAQRDEQGGLFRMLPLESLGQMMQIWE